MIVSFNWKIPLQDPWRSLSEEFFSISLVEGTFLSFFLYSTNRLRGGIFGVVSRWIDEAGEWLLISFSLVRLLKVQSQNESHRFVVSDYSPDRTDKDKQMLGDWQWGISLRCRTLLVRRHWSVLDPSSALRRVGLVDDRTRHRVDPQWCSSQSFDDSLIQCADPLTRQEQQLMKQGTFGIEVKTDSRGSRDHRCFISALLDEQRKRSFALFPRLKGGSYGINDCVFVCLSVCL